MKSTKGLKIFLRDCTAISLVCSVWSMKALASKPKFITGTEQMVSDLTGWLMGLAAAITGVLLIKTGYQWNIAIEEEKAKHKKNFFTILVVGVAIILAVPIVNWVFGYYQ